MDVEIIAFVVSLITLFTGFSFKRQNNHLLLNGKKTSAVIFKNECSEGDVYYPVVRFTTDKKVWITQKLNIGYSPAKPEGTKLEILYDPDDPTKIQINSPFQLEVLPVLLMSIGMVGTVVSILLFFRIIDVIG